MLTVNAWSASAAPGADESTFVPVLPARVLDTRDPTNVGLDGPFVSAVSQDLRITGSVRTTSGSKVVVPAGATGVALNVTVVGPSARGFLSIRPADAPGAPTTSNLNFESGAVTPNSVTVQLPTTGADAGKIEITFDAYGQAGPTTDVLIDIVGYTTRTGLADLQTQIDTLSAQLGSLPGSPTTSGLQTQLDQLKARLDNLTVTQITTITNEITEIREILKTMDVTAIQTQINQLKTILDSIPAGKNLTDVVYKTDPATGVLSGTWANPGLDPDSVGTTQLANAAVTAAKLAPGAIATTGLADGSVTTPKLADNAVTSTKIADGAIATTDLADASVTAAKLAPGAINGATLTPGSVTLSELGFVFGTATFDYNGTVDAFSCSPNFDVPVTGAVVGGQTVVLTSRTSAAVGNGGAGFEVEGATVTTANNARIRVCHDLGNNMSMDPWPLTIQFIVMNP